MDKQHRQALSRAHRGKRLTSTTKRAISRAMAGTSNFAGKSHTTASKDKIRHERGHDDRVRGRRWVVNAGEKTYRKRAAPAGFKLGHREYKKSYKTFREWME